MKEKKSSVWIAIALNMLLRKPQILPDRPIELPLPAAPNYLSEPPEPKYLKLPDEPAYKSAPPEPQYVALPPQLIAEIPPKPELVYPSRPNLLSPPQKPNYKPAPEPPKPSGLISLEKISILFESPPSFSIVEKWKSAIDEEFRKNNQNNVHPKHDWQIDDAYKEADLDDLYNSDWQTRKTSRLDFDRDEVRNSGFKSRLAYEDSLFDRPKARHKIHPRVENNFGNYPEEAGKYGENSLYSRINHALGNEYYALSNVLVTPKLDVDLLLNRPDRYMDFGE